MDRIFIGYFPKRRTTRSLPDPTSSEPAAEICSVSGCVARGPEGWEAFGKHNFYEKYDTPESAWGVVRAAERPEFALFAYWLLPVQFEDGLEEAIEPWWELTAVPPDRPFVRLGWDAVVGGNHHGFGCSPLSCNNRAGEAGVPAVNRFCLADTEADALEMARSFSVTKPEPGPYCVVEVWRASGPTA